MKLFAGYDGGGTKTACLLTDETGAVLGFGVGGPSNYLFCGKEAAADAVRQATELAFRDAGLQPEPLFVAYMASAAILLQHGESHVPFFQTCIDAETVLCESDVYPLWYAAERDRPAIVSIAGTGAITYHCSNEGFIRVGGWGPVLGDEGSGYDLGLQALRAACRMFDGREPMDRGFLDAIFAQYEAENPHGLLRALRNTDSRSTIASAAKTVISLYAQQNPTAAALLSDCADEIALAVQTAVLRAGQGPCPVILSGGIVGAQSPLLPMLEQRLLTPGTVSRISVLEHHPAVASAALALHHGGYESAADTLLEQTRGRRF